MQSRKVMNTTSTTTTTTTASTTTRTTTHTTTDAVNAVDAAGTVDAVDADGGVEKCQNDTRCTDSFISTIKEAPHASFMVVDTETASLKGPVVQIGLVLADKDGKTLQHYESIITYTYSAEEHQRGGWTSWCERAEAIHGWSKKALERDGISPKTAMHSLSAILHANRERGFPLVAHNFIFDKRMINVTAEAIGLNPLILDTDSSFCTMLWSQKQFRARKRNAELYMLLHGEEQRVGSIHGAIVDALITAANYARIVAPVTNLIESSLLLTEDLL